LKLEEKSTNFESEDKTEIIGLREEAPEWMTEGTYLETGFRINFNTYQ